MSAVISEALFCTILIEELTSNIYKRFADCAGGVTRTAFTYIAGESSMHADNIWLHRERPWGERRKSKCPAESGGFIDRLKSISRKLSEECPGRTELLSIPRFLASLEEYVGEEDYTRILVPALKRR